MPKLLQPSLTGGEISPALYGRVDLARYGSSLARCENFIVREYGGVEARPGLQFLGEVHDSAKLGRLIPFQVSEDVAYVVEMCDQVLRIWWDGALLMDGMSPLVIPTPWTSAQLHDIRFTQSADVLFLAHEDVQTQMLRRTGPAQFELVPFVNRGGPWRPLNSNESAKVASSASDGVVTLTSNVDIFRSEMVGSLILLEQKDMSSVRPWTPDERNVPLGTLRRSQLRVYRVSSVPSTVGLSGTPWYQTGNVRPVHDAGRSWDGPGDIRTDGTNQYRFGVEWEFVHDGRGVVQITAVTDAKTATGLVTQRVPNAVVGGLGAPGATWNFVGNGTNRVFSVTGAQSTAQSNYVVTINNVPVTSNPFQPPSSGGDGGGGGGGGVTPPFDPGFPELEFIE